MKSNIYKDDLATKEKRSDVLVNWTAALVGFILAVILSNVLGYFLGFIGFSIGLFIAGIVVGLMVGGGIPHRIWKWACCRSIWSYCDFYNSINRWNNSSGSCWLHCSCSSISYMDIVYFITSGFVVGVGGAIGSLISGKN